jgi:hypothetical protein
MLPEKTFVTGVVPELFGRPVRCATIERIMAAADATFSTAPPTRAKSPGEVLRGVLHGIEKRLWLRRAATELAFGACLVLFGLIAYRFALPSISLSALGALSKIAHPLALFGAVLVVVWQIARPVSAAQAAAEADRCLGLRDELKSARYFLSGASQGDMQALQIARAAATAAEIDARAVVAGKPSALWLVAAGFGALLWVTNWIVVPSAGWTNHMSSSNAGADSKDLRAMLEDVQADKQLRKLDRALQVLQDSGASPQEAKLAAAQAREAMDQADMEAAIAREGLASMAQTIKTEAGWQQVAQALEKGDARKAMELIGRLPAADATKATAEDEKFRSGEKGQGFQADEALEKSGRDLSGIGIKMNRDTVSKLLGKMEEAAGKIDAQERVNRVRRRMEDNLVATSQRSALTANEFGTRANAPNPTPAPETGNADLQGGTLFRQAAMAKENDDEAQHEGSRAGSSSGHSEALPLEGIATPRLEAQLKREAIARQEDKSTDGEDEKKQDWFYSASVEQKSALPYRDVNAGGGFAHAEEIRHAPVPIRQRKIVKNYFLNLNESENP